MNCCLISLVLVVVNDDIAVERELEMAAIDGFPISIVIMMAKIQRIDRNFPFRYSGGDIVASLVVFSLSFLAYYGVLPLLLLSPLLLLLLLPLLIC